MRGKLGESLLGAGFVLSGQVAQQEAMGRGKEIDLGRLEVPVKTAKSPGELHRSRGEMNRLAAEILDALVGFLVAESGSNQGPEELVGGLAEEGLLSVRIRDDSKVRSFRHGPKDGILRYGNFDADRWLSGEGADKQASIGLSLDDAADPDRGSVSSYTNGAREVEAGLVEQVSGLDRQFGEAIPLGQSVSGAARSPEDKGGARGGTTKGSGRGSDGRELERFGADDEADARAVAQEMEALLDGQFVGCAEQQREGLESIAGSRYVGRDEPVLNAGDANLADLELRLEFRCPEFELSRREPDVTRQIMLAKKGSEVLKHGRARDGERGRSERNETRGPSSVFQACDTKAADRPLVPRLCSFGSYRLLNERRGGHNRGVE